MALARIDVINERNAAICKALMNERPYKDQPWARIALAAAARAIRRGRLLTAAEQNENLARAFEEEGDQEIAALIRKESAHAHASDAPRD